MAYLIEDALLDTLTCDICEKYLSVLPIKVFPNRRSVCGRCTSKNPNWDGASSLYNIIGKKSLFKCVNRYDGCRELLRCSEVVAHENVCSGKKYSCPLCSDSEKIPTFLLYKHFERKHEDSVLEDPLIWCNLNSFSDLRNIYIYRFKDNLFFIYLILNRSEDIIKMKVLFIGEENMASSVSYNFFVNYHKKHLKICSNNFKCKTYENDNQEFYKMNIKDFNTDISIKVNINVSEETLINILKFEEPKILHSNNTTHNVKVAQEKFCLAVNNSVRKIEYFDIDENINFSPTKKTITLRKLYLSLEFRAKFPQFSLTECGFGLVEQNKVTFPVCINCDLGSSLFANKKSKHSLCVDCFNFLSNQNLIEKTDYSSLYWLNDDLKYFCSCNCDKTFKYWDYLNHEWEVKQDQIQQKCFICDEIHTLKELVEHMKIKHYLYGTVESSSPFPLDNYAGIFYVFLYDQLVFVKLIEYPEIFDVHLNFNKHNHQEIKGLLFKYIPNQSDKKIEYTQYVLEYSFSFNKFTTLNKSDCRYFLKLICS